MLTNDSTPRAIARDRIIEKADDSQITMVEKRFFGEIAVIGERHAEAAAYLKQALPACKTRGDEIRLEFQVEEDFSVALIVYPK